MDIFSIFSEWYFKQVKDNMYSQTSLELGTVNPPEPRRFQFFFRLSASYHIVSCSASIHKTTNLILWHSSFRCIYVRPERIVLLFTSEHAFNSSDLHRQQKCLLVTDGHIFTQFTHYVWVESHRGDTRLVGAHPVEGGMGSFSEDESQEAHSIPVCNDKACVPWKGLQMI